MTASRCFASSRTSTLRSRILVQTLPAPRRRCGARPCPAWAARWASSDDLHGDIEGTSGVGQGTHGDVVDTGVGDGAHGVQRHATGGLQRDPAADRRRPRRSAARRTCCPAGSGRRRPRARPHLGERVALHLDRQARDPRGGDGGRQVRGEQQVVVLDEHRVVEAHPVVGATTAAHGPLLRPRAAPGVVLRVSRMTALGARHGVHVSTRERRDARQTAQQVERQPLTRQDRTGGPWMVPTMPGSTRSPSATLATTLTRGSSAA